MSKVEVEFSWFSFVFGGNKALAFFIIIISSFNNSFLSLLFTFLAFIQPSFVPPDWFLVRFHQRHLNERLNIFEHIWAYERTYERTYSNIFEHMIEHMNERSNIFEHMTSKKKKLWHQHNNMQFRGQKNKSQILEPKRLKTLK